MPGYWHAHSDRDWEDECHTHDEPEPESELDALLDELAEYAIESKGIVIP